MIPRVPSRVVRIIAFWALFWRFWVMLLPSVGIQARVRQPGFLWENSSMSMSWDEVRVQDGGRTLPDLQTTKLQPIAEGFWTPRVPRMS